MNVPGGNRDLSELTPEELIARCRYHICGSDGQPDERCALNATHSMALIKLAEKSLVRPDDATPYSGDAWLESPGLAIGITKDSRGRWWAEAHQDGQRIVLCEIKTKGDRSRLCSVLSIPLTGDVQ